MTDPPDAIPPQRLRSMQIIAAALPVGAVTACAIMAYLVYQNGGQGMMQPQPGLPILSLLAAVLTVSNTVMALTLPVAQARAAVRRIASGAWQPGAGVAANVYPTDSLKLLAVRQTTIIIAGALLEGAAFFCAIAYLLEGQIYVLTGIAVTVALMLANFPTAGGLRAWLDRQLEAVRQARDGAPAEG
jgi:hypothetical protein